MELNWKQQVRPIIALSPMADMTDSAYCRIVKSIASPIVFREMVSAEAVIRGNDKTLDMSAIHEDERPLVQQIFGAHPDSMREAARVIEEEHHPEGIDINMGCPVYKITSNFNGAALMKEPELAATIVKEMKSVISVPLSTKMRAGWSVHTECIDFAKRMEQAGSDLITVHGRTKEQAYRGLSNRNVVREVKKGVQVPVLYNGDVFTHEDYFQALEETECDGVLIARGALGNPWIFRDIEARLRGEQPTPVTIRERIDVICQHLDLHLLQYGEQSITTFRKHLSWYFKGISNMKPYKQELMTTKNRNELIDILEKIALHLDE
ncbi:MAG: tRNA dihydrouridine synthase DusB [bacterium]|nr:tRNA dihydrouridine synthase DusB [bacterium]